MQKSILAHSITRETKPFNSIALAEKMAISPQTFAKWNERGEIPQSSLITLEVLVENHKLKSQMQTLKAFSSLLREI